jgi:hypothetical protein
MQTAEHSLEVVAVLVEGGHTLEERSVGCACCLALCQAGAIEALLKLMTGDVEHTSSMKVTGVNSILPLTMTGGLCY